ncbi:hypothetical protein [Lentzea sp. NBRC 102530]|uniref:hypothetical protein n=1 Tax=Lentzea sp. NBRC 102530 TaxID=3032201 RepID=UPI0024A2348D|nr:hypothetical protein [Lentzea sp. NBRC 102530]GLY55201.1 hypothetical protein Lesp01_88560 [Lentzea sp. NBRC 102530]
MAPVPAQPTHTVVPITLMIGNTAVSLGNLQVPLHARTDDELVTDGPRLVDHAARSALANLFRTAAAVIEEKTHGQWPRQAWWVGDRVPLPGSRDHGVVVQVDTRNRRYFVDTGKTKPVPVRWGQVDRLAAPCSLFPHHALSALAMHAYDHE